MSIAELHVQVHPGDGLVAHFGTAVVVLPEMSSRSEFADVLLGAVESGCATYGPAPGRQLIRKLAAVVTGADPDEVGSFGVAATADDGLAVMLCGSMDLHITGTESGKETLSGRDVATWVDRVVRSPFERLVLLPSDTAEHSLDPHTDLRSGTVSGSGITLSPRGTSGADTSSVTEPEVAPLPRTADRVAVAPEAPAPPLVPPPAAVIPDTPTTRETSFVSVELSALPPEDVHPLPIATDPVEEAAEEAAAGPEQGKVLGIYCSRGHFDDPKARFCAICGISMVQQTHNLVWGIRPSLGVLVLDDGASFVLDDDYVIGREPEASEQVRAGEARPLLIEDPELRVSRVHARLILSDWDVRIEDARSANGTSILRPGSDEWAALPPEEPTTISAGTRIRVSDRELVYDSHFQGS